MIYNIPSYSKILCCSYVACVSFCYLSSKYQQHLDYLAHSEISESMKKII